MTLRPSADVQARIRSANAANGWSVPTLATERTAIVARLALAITEVAEAIEVVRSPTIDDDHLAEELADVVIRLFDLGSGLNVEVLSAHTPRTDVPGGFDPTTVDGLVAALGVIAASTARLMDLFVFAPDGLPPTVADISQGLAVPCAQVEALASTLRLDLSGAVDAKIARNAARGFRHGGRTI